MTKTAHMAGALLLLCVLTLIFSPVAHFPSEWILLSVGAVVLASGVIGLGLRVAGLKYEGTSARQASAPEHLSAVGHAGETRHVSVLEHIGTLGWVALPASAGLLSGWALSVYPWQGATALREFIAALVVGLTVAILAQSASKGASSREVTNQQYSNQEVARLKGLNADTWLRRGIAGCCMVAGLGAIWLMCEAKHSAAGVAWLNSVENMNYWGFAFALLISCGVAVVLSDPVSTFKAIGISLTLLAVAALFTWLSLSYPSRGALLAALCAIALLVLLRFTRLPLKWLFAGTAGTFIFACLATFIVRDAGWMGYDELDVLSSRRLPIYDTTWALWQQAPWFGWGLDAYGSHGAVEVAKHMGGLFFPAPHNILLEMLYSLGLIGSALVLTTLGRILWMAMRAAKEANKPLAGLLATAIITTLVLHGATDLSIYRPYFFMLVFAAWGLIQGSGRQKQLRPVR